MRTVQIAPVALGLSLLSFEARGQNEPQVVPGAARPQIEAAAPIWPASPVLAPTAISPPSTAVQTDSRRAAQFRFDGATYRSPGLAVALSLQPLPIDFGNFYAENLGWGIACTAVEVSLMMPMMWFVGRHMDHNEVGDSSWSSGERTGMVGLMAGYVLVKLIAALNAGHTAQELNRRSAPRWSALIVPAAGGAVPTWHIRF